MLTAGDTARLTRSLSTTGHVTLSGGGVGEGPPDRPLKAQVSQVGGGAEECSELGGASDVERKEAEGGRVRWW